MRTWHFCRRVLGRSGVKATVGISEAVSQALPLTLHALECVLVAEGPALLLALRAAQKSLVSAVFSQHPFKCGT